MFLLNGNIDVDVKLITAYCPAKSKKDNLRVIPDDGSFDRDIAFIGYKFSGNSFGTSTQGLMPTL